MKIKRLIIPIVTITLIFVYAVYALDTDWEYKISIDSYSENGSYMEYPKINGLENIKIQDRINRLFWHEAWYGAKDYKGEAFVDFSSTDYIYDYNCKITFSNQYLLSYTFGFFAHGLDTGDGNPSSQNNSRSLGVTIDLRDGKKINLTDFMEVDERLIHKNDGDLTEPDYFSEAKLPFHKFKDAFEVYETEDEKDNFHWRGVQEAINDLKDPMKETRWYINENKEIVFSYGSNWVTIPYKNFEDLIYPEYVAVLVGFPAAIHP